MNEKFFDSVLNQIPLYDANAHKKQAKKNGRPSKEDRENQEKKSLVEKNREKRRTTDKKYDFSTYSLSDLYELRNRLEQERSAISTIKIDNKDVNVTGYILSIKRRDKQNGTETPIPEHIASLDNHVQNIQAALSAIGSYIKETSLEHDLEIVENFKDKLIELFAKGYSVRELHKLVLDNTDKKDLSFIALEQFKAAYQTQITNLSKTFQDKFDDLPLSHKRRRIEELQELFYVRKDEFQNTHSVNDSKEIRAILNDIKDECEGMTLRIDATLKQAIEIHIMQDEIQGINPLQIVLGNIAGKQGINPLWFMARLANSYYAKLNGYINANIADDFNTELLYPSQALYDFEKLEQKAKEIAEEDKQEMYLKIEQPSLTESELEEIERIKNVFISKLKKSKQ